MTVTQSCARLKITPYTPAWPNLAEAPGLSPGGCGFDSHRRHTHALVAHLNLAEALVSTADDITSWRRTVRHCRPCAVEWKGTATDPCWNCGGTEHRTNKADHDTEQAIANRTRRVQTTTPTI